MGSQVKVNGRRVFGLFIFVVCGLFFYPAASLAAPPLEITSQGDSFLLGKFLDVYEDKSTRQSLDDVMKDAAFIPLGKDLMNGGFSRSAYWFRGKLVNKGAVAEKFILEADNPALDYLELHIFRNGGKHEVHKAGDHQPFFSREIIARTFAFSVPMEQGEEAEFYVRAQTSSSILVPLIFWREAPYMQNLLWQTNFFGVIIGVSILILVYNFFLYVSLRDKNYLLYVLYILFFFLISFDVNGVAFNYFWPNSVWLANGGAFLFAGLAILFSLIFTRSFLETRRHAPFFDKLLVGFMGVAIFYAASPFIFDDYITGHIGVTAGFLYAPLVMIAGCVCLWRGVREARFFLVAWVFSVVGLVAYLLMISGLTPYNFVYYHGMELGYSFEAVLLSLALSDRINILRQEKNQAQQMAMEQKQLVLDTLRKAKDELEAKVAERTAGLNMAKEQAEDATKLKDKFVALVSHDLRAPLASSMGFLKLAQNLHGAAMTPELRQVVDRVVKSSGAQLEMIDQLLDISRLHTGKVVVAKKFVNAHALFAIQIVGIEGKIAEKGVSITNALPTEMQIFVDPVLFGQVAANLLSNASKFCRAGDRVSVEVVNGDRQTILVKDTGVGISPDILPDLFLHEVKTTTRGTSDETGTGLGLPFCRDIVEAHGGEIRAESPLGGGAIFSIMLPEARAIVLLVDDNEANRIIMKRHLKENFPGVEVMEGGNGQEALETLRNVTPHLIITDIIMPVIGGLELLEHLRKEPRLSGIPVIVATSDHSSSMGTDGRKMDVRMKAFDLGAKDFVLKPVIPSDFLPRVRRFISPNA